MPYLDAYFYNQEVLDLLTWTGYAAVVEQFDLMGYMFFSAYTITLIGLLMFMSWARATFVILTSASLVLTALGGVQILMPIDGVLSYFTNLADGATIILIYFTSISNKFNEKT